MINQQTAKTAAPASAVGAELPGYQIIGKKQIQDDAKQLVSLLESTHPAFSLGDIPKGYSAAKEQFLTAADKEMTVDDFRWLSREYLASMGDGHTAIWQNFENDSFLNIFWVVNGDHLDLTDQQGNCLQQEVIAIGGVGVQTIFQTVNRYFSAENSAGLYWNGTLYSGFTPILSRSGVDCSKGSVVLTIKSGTQTVKKRVGFIDQNPNSRNGRSGVVSTSVIGDIFYIDFNECKTGLEIDKAAIRLSEAIAKGFTKVIVDVSDNSGGDSSTEQQLLAMMAMRPPSYGVYTRFSHLYSEAKKGLVQEKEGAAYVESKPNLSTAVRNKKISLVVLTNEGTFSSATQLAVWVQDGKLGTVIGTPSANSPNCYGDYASFQLNNTGISGQASCKRWLRPDETANPKALIPDIPTPYNVDSLKVAIRYLDDKA